MPHCLKLLNRRKMPVHDKKKFFIGGHHFSFRRHDCLYCLLSPVRSFDLLHSRHRYRHATTPEPQCQSGV
jgi:hypothetical protein